MSSSVSEDLTISSSAVFCLVLGDSKSWGSRSVRRHSHATRARRRSSPARNSPTRSRDHHHRHDHREREPPAPEAKSRKQEELQRTIATAKTENIEVMEDITILDLTYLMIDNSINMQAVLRIFDVNLAALELRNSTRQVDVLKAFAKSKPDGHGVYMLNKSEGSIGSPQRHSLSRPSARAAPSTSSSSYSTTSTCLTPPCAKSWSRRQWTA